MRKTIIRTLKILAVALPVLLFVLLDPGNDSYDRNKLRDFYRERPNTLDVVVLGASEVYSDYSAVRAYEKYGFTSYPYAMSANRMELYQSQLEEIFAYQDPELVLIEITPGMYEEPLDTMDVLFQGYIERVPLSANKIRAVMEFGDRDQWLSYFFPFIAHHNITDMRTALSIMLDELFLYQQGYSRLKGSSTATWHGHEHPAMALPTGKYPMPEYGKEMLRSLLTYCQEKQYDNVVFVTFPHRISSEYGAQRSMQMHAAGELIESYGYPYINLETASEEMGLDSEIDYQDDDHLNLYGQVKLTDYLAKILTEDYGIGATELSSQDRQRWERSVDYYNRFYAFFDEMYTQQPEESRGLWESRWLYKNLPEGDVK